MLFGHQNNDDNAQQNDTGFATNDNGQIGQNPLAVDPVTGESLPVVPEGLEHIEEMTPAVLIQPIASTAGGTAQPSETPDLPSTPPKVIVSDELLQLKQQALQQLSPLVGHLDQTPEEKFRTTMMMIQSSDNQALIKEAYTAAGLIADDKVRAQALLDIVNEINYFTQQAQVN